MYPFLNAFLKGFFDFLVCFFTFYCQAFLKKSKLIGEKMKKKKIKIYFDLCSTQYDFVLVSVSD